LEKDSKHSVWRGEQYENQFVLGVGMAELDQLLMLRHLALGVS
jgi:hypothetical protein